ncbi:MAG: minichromosome maintenance protein MCM [Candidatus Aenigmarchaeota archaeon]|nr:minichromosome maintenance protein MCM [Candidatus Aenigmarchaeota archaeon]MCX8191037.1 minichromosome maintenance protein MCM [Candidatus Aenigmarchaeota archaeon]MDW8160307.1 minichromosome maintenance protein MCM [Candidatus Aenigmarchaeota archaeon]
MEEEKLLERFLTFLEEYYKEKIILASNEGKSSIDIDFSELEKFDFELAEYLLEYPEETLKKVEASLGEIDPGLQNKRFHLRFYNLPEIRNIRIRNLRSEHIGKFLSIDGIVKRASEVRPEVYETDFQCTACGEIIKSVLEERTIKPPQICQNCGNRKGFKVVSEKYYDTRWIVIEEPFEITSGERPSDLIVYLKEDLVTPKMQYKTDPGNRIRVTGVLKQLPRRVKGSISRQMEIYLEANHIESVETEWEEIEISEEDEKKIFELAKDPQIYDKIVASIAPSIFGLEDVKLAIALQLFGGVEHVQKDKSRVRGEIHILLVGEPSTAKTSLMNVITTLIPRARYVSGKGLTGVGLTATVTRDEELFGGWVLEAGALVLCNKSLLAIDEFEKIDKQDMIALHEAMESGKISIAKANIVATLPAKTSILAGGNPKFTRFDPYIPIKEQLDVPETILTRFDLKFALKDIPNPEIDEKIVTHILEARHFGREKIEAPIPPDLFRKYVAYARKNCFPQLTEEAAEEIKKFFIDLRKKSTEGAPIAITMRQYEALIRLSEASAKIQLRDKVTKEDALRAIRLLSVSLRQFGFEPETGELDIDRAEGAKATAVQRSKIRTVIKLMEDMENLYGKELSYDEVVKKAKAAGIEDIEEILKKMQQEGVIYFPRTGFISRL